MLFFCSCFFGFFFLWPAAIFFAELVRNETQGKGARTGGGFSALATETTPPVPLPF